MKPISKTTIGLTLAILFLSVMFIMNNDKVWNYKKTQSVEYNPEYNEKHPVIDTIIVLYKNANPILVRSGFSINGHDKIGFCNGGSQVWFECSDTCIKCK